MFRLDCSNLMYVVTVFWGNIKSVPELKLLKTKILGGASIQHLFSRGNEPNTGIRKGEQNREPEVLFNLLSNMFKACLDEISGILHN